jgi:hypothetical protein
VTVPVGVAEPEISLTAAVKVTPVSEAAVAAEEVRAVMVAASALTVRLTADDVLVAKLLSPL